MDSAIEPTVEIRPPRRRRIMKIVVWLVGLGLFWLVLQLLGVDVRGWLDNLWDQIQAIWEQNPGYIIAALGFQTGQTVFAGLAYYGILRGLPGRSLLLADHRRLRGRRRHERLPAGEHRHLRDAAHVRRHHPELRTRRLDRRLPGAEDLLHHRRDFVYLYMFLSVPGSFDISFGNLTSHPGLTLIVVAGIALLLFLLGRIFWRQVKKLWAQAKQGGVILSTPSAT